MLLIQGPDSDYTVSAGGQYTFAPSLVGQQVTIIYQHTVPAYSALENMGLSLANGYPGQPVWGYLASDHPAQALGYSGIAYTFAPAYDLGSSVSVDNHSFEVGTPWEAVASGDADPSAIGQDILTSGRYGANFPASKAGDFSAWSNYALAQNLVMSPALTQQKPGAEWLKYLLDLSNTDVVWSQGVLKYVPLGDAACTANGATYTPNTTPAYDLTEDHFLVDNPDEDPLKVERRANDDTYNHVRLEYCNRDNQYNLEVVEAKDAADIDRRGLRTKDVVEAHAICDPAVARMLVTLLLQRELGVRNVYKFQLPWTFALLEPLDLVTVSDAWLALTRVPVRINTITELASGDFDVEAEDCPIGLASAPAYGVQAGSGFAHDYNASPGSVTPPVIFEAPVERTTTGLELYAAVTGADALWGGCRVWVSLDGGTNYKVVDTVRGGSRYGTLQAALGAGDLSAAVALAGNGGQLLSGTAGEAAQNQTLCWLDGAAGGEYLNYVTAALTGANAYTLSGLVRGAYGNPPAAHAIGAKFVRVDGQLGKSGPLETSLVGAAIQFKFTSFNVFGGGEQSLADVPAYSYTVTGGQLQLPPSDVGAITHALEQVGIRLSWPAIADPDVDSYELRLGGTDWDSAALLGRVSAPATEYLWRVQSAGAYTLRIKALDTSRNPSTTASTATITVAAPAAPVASRSVSGPNETIAWTIPAGGGFLVDRYEVRHGPLWGTGTVVEVTKATSITRRVDYAGARTYMVAAVDIAGNYGAVGSVAANVVAPPAPTASVAFDGEHAVLGWSQDTLGSLPVAGYEIYVGSVSPGNLVAEVTGTTWRTKALWLARSYLVRAVDTAGTPGAAATVVADVTPAGVPAVSYTVDGELVRLAFAATPGSLPILRYEARFGTTWATGVPITEISGTAITQRLDWAGNRTFWVAAVDTAQNFTISTGTTISGDAPPAPNPVVALSGKDVIISWPEVVSQLPLDGYEVRFGASYAAGTFVARIKGTSLQVPATWLGARTFWVAAINSVPREGAAGSIAVTVSAPAAPVVSASFSGPNAVLAWAAPAATLPIAEYEVRWGDTWAGGTSLGRITATTLATRAAWLGSRTFWVAGIDAAGNVGAPGSTAAVVSAAPVPTVQPQVLDNNVLLYWSQVQGTLPTETYEVRKGATWAGATVVGKKSGGFTSVFELEAGTYTYWIAAVDSAGNYGTPASVTTAVAEPPDYLLATRWVSDYSGTKNNTVLEAGKLVLPVNAAETFEQHFTSHGWTTPQQQVDAGYPILLQPGMVTGYYEEDRDYGTTLAAMKITVSYLLTVLAGSVSAAVTITTALDAGFTVGVQTFSGAQAYVTNFRHVRIRVTVTATNDQGLATLADLSAVLDAKLMNDAGTATLTLGGAHAQGNIAPDYKSIWVPGMAMPPAGWTLHGTDSAAANAIELQAGPSGELEPVWVSKDLDVGSDMDGGWSASAYGAVDFANIGALYGVLCKRINSVDGATYMGPQNAAGLLTLAGVADSNIYFISGLDMPALDTWYLLVGYVHKIGYGTTDTGLSGIYNLAGTKLTAGIECKANTGTTTTHLRAFYYGATGNTGQSRQYLARPVVIPCTEAAAPDMISYLLRCAKEYGAVAELNKSFVDVTAIELGAQLPAAGTPTTPLYDFEDVAYPQRFNIFNFDQAGAPVGGTVGWAVKGY